MGAPLKRNGNPAVGTRTLASASVFESETVTRSMKAAGIKKSGTRAAMSFIKPYWRKTAWWVLIAVFVFVLLTDINVKSGGWVSQALIWFREDVMKEWQIVGITIGFMLRHYLFRDEIWKGHDKD